MFFLQPKINHITEQLQQISLGTSNSGVLNSVIAYINSNISKFSPAINYTQLNSTIQTYMTNNINLFKGAKGDPYVIPQADLDQALTDYVNTHPTSFVKSVANKSNVVVLNQGDIQSGPISGTTATLTGALNAASAVLSGALTAMSASFTGLNCTSGLSTKNLLATGTTTLTGSTTLTGDLTGNNASFNGTLSANTLSLTGDNSLLQVQGGTIRATNGKISTLGTDILIVNSYISAPFVTTNIDITGITGNYNLSAAFVSNGVIIIEDYSLRARTDTINITLPDSGQFVNGTYVDIVNVTYMTFTVNNRTVIPSEATSKNNYARMAVMTVARISTWCQIGG